MLNIEVKPLTTNSEVKDNTNTYNIDNAYVSIDKNKLILTPDAVKALNAIAGDRIAVNYWTVDSTKTFPVIGKAECFSDNSDGNRLTKSNTISFRGNQQEILKEYGDHFRLIPFNKYFAMEKVVTLIEIDEFKEEKQDLENLN